MIEAVVVGDKEIIAKLSALPEGLRKTITDQVTKLGFKLQRHVQADKLSGQVLKVRTGILRSSINLKVDQGTSEVIATVGTKVSYARVHEFGFKGAVSVRAHLRQVKQVFGRPVSATQNVKAHSRNVNLPERSFLRSALKDMEVEIKTSLERAVREEVAKVVSG
jgi:phage gpG-like protein